MRRLAVAFEYVLAAEDGWGEFGEEWANTDYTGADDCCEGFDLAPDDDIDIVPYMRISIVSNQVPNYHASSNF
jgi:hypothetical protein